MTEQKENKLKKTLKGKVVSDKMDKTIVVTVERFVKHPKYKKYVKINKNFKVHDENNQFKTGDTVKLVEVRPISKDKRFKAIEE